MKEFGIAILLSLVVAVIAGPTLAVMGDGEDEDVVLIPTAPAAPATPAAPADTPEPTPTEQLTGAALGEAVASDAGCLACHTTDGTEVIGPTWQGLFGSQETLDDGTTVTVDEAYLRESIVDPNAAIVEGFQAGMMPTNFGELLSEEEIDGLIEYIQTLQ